MEIASPDEVKAAAAKPETMILDVRTKEEVAESSLAARDFKHASCHLEECSELMSKAEELFPDKNGTRARAALVCFTCSVWMLTTYLISALLIPQQRPLLSFVVRVEGRPRRRRFFRARATLTC